MIERSSSTVVEQWSGGVVEVVGVGVGVGVGWGWAWAWAWAWAEARTPAASSNILDYFCVII